jgi:TIR domain
VRYDIFISYARADHQRVEPLVVQLRDMGFRVFFDLGSIRVGDRWKPSLESSLKKCRVLLLCWSAQAKASEFVQFECAKAVSSGKDVLPWLLDETPLPAMLELQGITAAVPAVVAAALSKRIGWNLTRRRLLAAGVAGLAAIGGTVGWLVRRRLQSFEVRGVVVDPDNGLPLAGVEVLAESGSSVTDINGQYVLRLRGEKPDYVRLRYRKRGYREDPMNVPTEGSFNMVMAKATPNLQ